jgi:rod shape-determining protein MreC
MVTSGDGGLFPEGIPIGVVVSVDNSNPLQVTATIRPYSQIGKLEDVFIMIPYVDPEENAAPSAQG